MISDANCSVVEQKQENNWPVAGGLLGGRFIRTDTVKFVETAAFFQAFRYNRQRLAEPAMSEYSKRSIQQYYAEYPAHDRLRSARGQLELERTQRIVQRFLARTP